MEIRHGLSNKCVEQLISYTNSDKTIQEFTSDLKRFKDMKSYQEWLKKGRSVYSLVDEEGNLVGISWFGEENGFTLALRIYGKARGKGLGYDFLRKTMEDFMKGEKYKKAKNQNWWLETSKNNIPAIKIYEKLGFKFDGFGENPGKAIYRRHPDFEF